MSVSAEQLLAQAQKVLEARGFRVVQVTEAVEAEAVAAKERSEADASNSVEDAEIAAFKDLAAAYTKE
jgi:hypothetical protein